MDIVMLPRFTGCELRTASSDPSALVDTPCPRCGEVLDLQTPNPLDPDRLLAVCLDCGTWQYIEISPDGGEAVMIPLPDAKYYWSLTSDRHDQALSDSPSAA